MTLLGALGWLALCAGLVALPGLLLAALAHPERVEGAVERARARWRPARVEAAGPPIERLAVELRRLHAVRADLRPVSWVRHIGVEEAYDRTLAEACWALGVEQHVAEVPMADREFERLRVEAMLESAGLPLQVQRGRY
jgi:hypothetical protein